jgi:malonyl-CoA O-methyltransferase
LPLFDGGFELVVSNLTLQWCNDPRRVFRELSRVLQPGGHLLLSTFGPHTLCELRSSWSAIDSKVHTNHFPSGSFLARAMRDEGLEVIASDRQVVTARYQEVRALMRELKAWGAHNVNRGRPTSLTGRTTVARLETAYEQFRLDDGHLPATFELLVFHAQKTTSDSFSGHHGPCA